MAARLVHGYVDAPGAPGGARRRVLAALATLMLAPVARAHHGWSSFDQNRPIYLAGTVRAVRWANPHAELELEPGPEWQLPRDLSKRPLQAQQAPVDGAALLAASTLPRRRDKLWTVELAPLTRMQAWGVEPLKVGEAIELVGFTFREERGDAVVRVEYLFRGGKAYALRSSPA